MDKFGVDGIDRSIGVLDEKVPVNAPTVYNAALHIKQFWDGRMDTVEQQALGPITAVPEMGFTNSLEDQAQVLKQLGGIGRDQRKNVGMNLIVGNLKQDGH